MRDLDPIFLEQRITDLEKKDNIYYVKGDIVELTELYTTVGFIQNSKKSIVFFIPLTKKLNNIDSVNVDKLEVGVKSQTNSYLDDSYGDYDWKTKANITVDTLMLKQFNVIKITINKTVAFSNAPNDGSILSIIMRNIKITLN